MWGLSGVIIKWIDMEALSVGFWRFLVYAAIMCGWLVARGNPPNWYVMRNSMWGGLSLGIDIVCFFTAVKLTNIVNATTIGSLQPLIVAVFAARMFGERIKFRDIGAALVAIGAVVVIVVESSGTPQWSGTGDLFAVGALFSWAAYFVFSKRSAGGRSPRRSTPPAPECGRRWSQAARRSWPAAEPGRSRHEQLAPAVGTDLPAPV